jgi:alpha-2-macroglobulin
MRNFLFSAGILAIFCLSSCIKKINEVAVSQKNFEEEISLQQNLVFTFNKDLAPDTLIGKWDTTAYIRFDPDVRGQFKWTNRRELVFSPSSRFTPSTRYKAELLPALLRHADKRLFLTKERIIGFHTPFLALAHADIFWTRNEGTGKVEVQATLNFNSKVDPVELARRMKVKIADRPVVFRIITGVVSEAVVIAIGDVNKANASEKMMKVEVEKGLKCAESDWITDKPLSLTVGIPSPDHLQISQVIPEFEGGDGVMKVYTNQEVDDPDIRSRVKVSPEVELTIEKTEYGFSISGPFVAGTTYDLRISKKLKGILGGDLVSDYTQQVPFGELRPSISFTSAKGVYLSSKGSLNVGLNLVNVPSLSVTVYRVYENNIIHYLENNRYSNGYYDEEYDEYVEDGHGYSTSNIGSMGDQVFSREYQSRDLQRIGGTTLLNIPLDESARFKGFYVVTVGSTDKSWIRSTRLISVSDIGLIAKKSEDDIIVFANSIKTTGPLAGIKISFISTNNQTVHTATTDGSGVAVFSGMKSQGFAISMITARDGGDFNFMYFNDNRVETSRFDVGGIYNSASGYHAYMYGDRDIYRPGETVYLNSIVRTNEWQNVADIPVKIRVTLPNGREFLSLRKNLDAEGSVETSFALPSGAVTGKYTVELYSGNDVFLQSRSINVEEFMPDRIKVNLALSKTELSSNDSLSVRINALNLFGPPAANRNYEADFSLQRKYFSAPGYSDYTFSITGSEKVVFSNDLRQGKTDENGAASEAFSVSEEYKDIGMLTGKVFATVFDESGRPVNRVRTFDVYTQSVFFGLRYQDSYISSSQPLTVPVVALDKHGKPVRSATARVQVIKYNWQNVIQRSEGGQYRYVSEKQEQVLVDRTLALSGGAGSFTFTPKGSGNFEVRIMKPGVNNYVSQSFYAYEWGSTQNSSFEVNTEGQVTIEPEKQKYNPGDKASILFKTPFQGRLLVTVERDKVLDYYVLETDKKSAVLSLPIRENYLPNVYISATLIKPLDDGSLPLTVAHGYANLTVEKTSNILPLTIEAPEKSRSKTKQTITVKTTPRSDISVTLAVVDEGILQLKDFKTPDAYSFFYQKKALEVNSFDLYPSLFPDLKMKKSSTGGDGYDLSKRVNPLTNKRVQFIALWSGILKTNGAGEASYTIDIPQFSGDLRIMAMAYKDKAFGSAEMHMKVADPIVISSSLPRFATPGDTVLFPVTLTNTTAKATKATAKVSVSGAMGVVGSVQQTASVKPNSEQTVTFTLVGRPMVGEAVVNVAVNALGETFSDRTDMTVRPSTSLQKRSETGSIGDGLKTLNFSANFIPSSVSAKLVISRSPLVQFTDNLTYLLGYPHGCIEQTVSKAFPQIYFNDLIKSIYSGNKTIPVSNPAFNVQEAVRKLNTMQLPNGALAYWPGGSYESWWGSVFAAHFLYEAKKAGFDVSNDVTARLYGYLAEMVKRKDTQNYYYYDGNGKYTTKIIASKEIAYSLYILALANRADISTMNYYKANLSQLSLDSRYLLAAAYLKTGDRASYSYIIPKSFSGEAAKNETGGSFYSYIRDQAVVLNTLLETDPNNPQVPVLAKHLSEQIRNDRYLNTQENVFAFLALGKLMKITSRDPVSVTVSVDGKELARGKGEMIVLSKGIAGKQVNVNAKGKLYYFWEMEGITMDGSYKNEDSYLKVRKKFLSRTGAPVSGTTFRQNDLVVVKLTISTTDNTYADNVVITDMLPAGFEIENPRVGAVPELEWIKDNSSPDHFDIRDDRINLYARAEGQEKHFYYLVRAVSMGSFVMGPVSADAMYNGEYHSYNGAGKIKVTR